MTIKTGLAVLLLAGAMALPAAATTVTFDRANIGNHGSYTEDGMIFDVARIVNGNCDNSASGKPCMTLNKNEISVLSSVSGALFNLTSFWFKLLGDKAALTVTSSAGGSVTLNVGGYGHNNNGNIFDMLGNALFENVEWVKFDNTGKGNVRVDDIATSIPAAVPVPAAGLMLMAGLGGLAALRRKRQTA